MRFLADENFDGRVVNGLRRKEPHIEIARVIDVGLSGAGDPEVLEWAAENNYVILTHDVSTMVNFAYERVLRGERMPGLVEVSSMQRIQSVVADLVLLYQASLEGEWEGQVIYLPL